MIDIRAKELLSALLHQMGVEFDRIEVELDEKMLRLNILSPRSSLLIGYHGETANALQHLLKSMVWHESDERSELLLVVDVDNYKKRQEENLFELAERKAARVSETGVAEPMPPSVNAYQRRLLHSHFTNHATFPEISTESRGDGYGRQLFLVKKEA